MTDPQPTKIIIEYDDGTKTAVSYESLTDSLRFELLRQPALARLSLNPENEKYIILSWEDGWREVAAVNRDCLDINRYYVISRPEDVGRLSINKKDGYPELVEIGRRPLNLSSVTLTETMAVTPEKSTREGKKTDHFFKMKPDGDVLAELKQKLKDLFREKNITGEPESWTEAEKVQRYEEIRRKLGLRAAFRQQDALNFIAFLIKSVA